MNSSFFYNDNIENILIKTLEINCMNNNNIIEKITFRMLYDKLTNKCILERFDDYKYLHAIMLSNNLFEANHIDIADFNENNSYDSKNHSGTVFLGYNNDRKGEISAIQYNNYDNTLGHTRYDDMFGNGDQDCSDYEKNNCLKNFFGGKKSEIFKSDSYSRSDSDDDTVHKRNVENKDESSLFHFDKVPRFI